MNNVDRAAALVTIVALGFFVQANSWPGIAVMIACLFTVLTDCLCQAMKGKR